MSIQFSDATNESGIIIQGQSYGASWGDFNGDTLPDLWVGDHFSPVKLYLNLGNGTFRNIASTALQEDGRDTHTAAWGDFDNDGDQDLIQLTGAESGEGEEPNLFFVNSEGRLVNQANRFGLEYPFARGRTPLWFDYDNDGLLDLAMSAFARPDGQAPPTIFRQSDTGFENVGVPLGFSPNTTRQTLAFLADLSGDGTLDLGYRSGSPPLTVYDTTTTPFTNLTPRLFPDSTFSGQYQDIIAADFNGDLRTDLYLTRRGREFSDLFLEKTDRLQLVLNAANNEKEVFFETSGPLSFEIFQRLPIETIFIGQDGYQPTDHNFTVSPSDAASVGILPHTAGVDRGLYIGFDTARNRWQINWSSPEDFDRISAIIQSSDEITNLTSLGFNSDSKFVADQLLINTGNGFVDQSQEAGITALLDASGSAIAADFDNDMDIDLFIVSRGPAGNLPNLFYENQGDGTFRTIDTIGAATGTSLGLGESVATADYDLDGFLDLFITNGAGSAASNLLTRGAPNQLFRNLGNDNHWLQIDLEGIVSNRDGIGAQVFVTTSGVTQLREQSGGMHLTAQNHQRLHFGLADNTVIDEVEVRWPSGIIQRLTNIPADQLIKITESPGPFISGQPDLTIGDDLGVFIWKETFDGPYTLRTLGTGIPGQGITFDINLLATEALLNITPINLNANDQFQAEASSFSFNSWVSSGEDQINFQLAPGAKALLSIAQDGIANPRQVNIGRQKSHLIPAGWVVSSASLLPRPAFTPGQDLGLFVGQGNTSNNIEFRWNGDGQFHQTDLTVISANSNATFTPTGLDDGGKGRDTLIRYDTGVNISGGVGTADDGLNVTVTEDTQLGFAYQQDNIFQSHQINPFNDQLGLPNAYELPLATPFGQPSYNPAQNAGLFLWKNEQTGVWSLRATAGGDTQTYSGSIVAGSTATSVQSIGLEPNDSLDSSEPLQIDFEFNVVGSGEDGIDFHFLDESVLSLTLDSDPSLLSIGSQKWSVSQVPLDLSGWS